MNLAPTSLPDRFYIDLAIGVSPFEHICRTYGLDPEDIHPLEADPQFNQRLLLAQQAVDDDGRAFRARCRTETYECIPAVREIALDPDAPAAARIEAFKTLVKFGALEPKETTQNGATGPQIAFSITFAGGERQEATVGTTIDTTDFHWIES